MEQPEVPLEHLQEHVEHHAHASGEQWVSWVALSTALLAAFAAVCSLLAGFHANEAMIQEIESANQWAYYQAKGIKSVVLQSKMDMVKEMGKEVKPADLEKAAQYKEEQKEIDKSAREKESVSSEDLLLHNKLARAVTVFQIAIAICAISALTKRKWLWYGSMILCVTGIFLMLLVFF